MSEVKTTETFKQSLASLNEGQRRAVEHIEGPVMVLAGPGTGKTQTLAMRVANILQNTQMDPHNILLLTFTESGVVAMRERLMSIIGTPAYHVGIHTFHSFCNTVIQDHPDLFAKTRQWQSITDVEQIQMMQEILDSLPGTSVIKHISDPYMYLRDILSAIKELKAEDISPEDFLKILQGIQAFTEKTNDFLEEFYAVKASKRDDASCDRVYEHLKRAASECSLNPSLVAVFKSMYAAYETKRDAAEGKRESQKARTAFKDAIKKWHTSLKRDVAKHADLQKVYVLYQEKLEEMGRYDFEDMILQVVAAFKEHDELLGEYQEQYQYMLVDEYQDTNGAQNEIVELLASFDETPNVFVVGDDKQSIFRFQGASLNNMLVFYERYRESVEVVSLKENYRSQQAVLDAASAVIGNNEESLAKYIPGITTQLESQTGRQAEKLELHSYETEEVEYYAVVQQIQALIDQGVPANEIAVLYRVNRDGDELLRMLRKAQVSARLEVGENVLDSVPVQQWLTLLAYIDRGDATSLGQILLYDWFELPSLDAMKVLHYAGRSRTSIFDVISSKRELNQANVLNPDAFLELAERLAAWRKLHANVTVLEFLHTLLEESGWVTWVTKTPGRLVVLKKVSAVLAMIKEMNRSDPTMTLRDLLNHIDLLQEYGIDLDAPAWQVSSNAVHLMTAHKAKGLEFEYVFVVGLNSHHWEKRRAPSKLTLPHGLVKFDAVVSNGNNEDDRRLFYVVLTRAKQKVVMTRSRHTGSGRETVASLFTREIPAELMSEVEHEGQEEELVSGLVVQEMGLVPAASGSDVREWLSEMLKTYVMSVTHLNHYLEDPQLFYERHILQIPSAPTQSQALGTAVHNALEDFTLEFRQAEILPSKDWLLERYTFHANQVLLSEAQRKNVLEEGLEQLSAYYDHYKDSFSPYVMSEYNFRAHGVHVGDLELTGKVDKIELLDSSDVMSDGSWRKGARVHVIDYKTGNPDRKFSDMKPGGNYYRQLVFYKLLCDESPQFPYTVESVQLEFIQPSEKRGFVKESRSVTDEEVEELRGEIQSAWEGIKALSFLEPSKEAHEIAA